MIYDCHAHIASSLVLPAQWYDGWIENISRSLSHEPSAQQQIFIRDLFKALNQDEFCTNLLLQMEEAHIDKTALLAIDWGMTYKELDDKLEDVLLFHKKILDEHKDKFWVFSAVDPRRGKEGLDIFEKSIRTWGFHGLKIYPPCGYSPSDPLLYPYYEICQTYHLPVITHIGPSSPSLQARFAQPIEVDTAAWQFPKVNFIMAHGAVTYPDQCGLLAAHRPNIYLDVSGFQMHAEEKLKAIFTDHLKLNLQTKLLFGTDWPIHFFYGSQAKAFAKFESLKHAGIFNETIFDWVVFKNFHHLIDQSSWT